MKSFALSGAVLFGYVKGLTGSGVGSSSPSPAFAWKAVDMNDGTILLIVDNAIEDTEERNCE